MNDEDDKRRKKALVDAVLAAPRAVPTNPTAARLFISAYLRVDLLAGHLAMDESVPAGVTRLDELGRCDLLQIVWRLDRARFNDHIPDGVLLELTDAELRGLVRALRRRHGEFN